MPKKAIKKMRIQGYLHPSVMESVKDLAEKHGVTVSDIVVASVYMYLNEHGGSNDRNNWSTTPELKTQGLAS